MLLILRILIRLLLGKAEPMPRARTQPRTPAPRRVPPRASLTIYQGDGRHRRFARNRR